MVKAGLLFGAVKSRSPEKTRTALEGFFAASGSLPFDDVAPSAYATIPAGREPVGTPIGPKDLEIAATALAHGAILVTHNTREFGRGRGLTWEDWE